MICVPIKKKSLLNKAQKEADLVEIWFDEINKKDWGGIFSKKKIPFIYKSTNPQNVEHILKYKPEYIDVDIKTTAATIKKIKKLSPRIKIIISFHDFKKNTPN